MAKGSDLLSYTLVKLYLFKYSIFLEELAMAPCWKTATFFLYADKVVLVSQITVM